MGEAAYNNSSESSSGGTKAKEDSTSMVKETKSRLRLAAKHLKAAASILVRGSSSALSGGAPVVTASSASTGTTNKMDDYSGSRTDHIPSPMPQANITDSSLKIIESRDWRWYFSKKLRGKGLEIGPLHRPIPTHAFMQVDYIDRYPLEMLRAHYPELKEYKLVEPNIIGDAETFSNVPDESYDFVVSAHVIEHMKNPVLSLQHWCRVLKPGGKIYLIVPDKRVIFDKKRVRTTLEHLLLDYYRPSAERDFEHALEYGLHVHNKTGFDAIKEGDNIVNTNYSIHYHVFIPEDIVRLIEWFSLNIQPLKILEGPVMAPGLDEFHLLLEKGA